MAFSTGARLCGCDHPLRGRLSAMTTNWRYIWRYISCLVLAWPIVSVSALADPVRGEAGKRGSVRIVYLDPLSGPYEDIGRNNHEVFTFAVDHLVNRAGGVLGGRRLKVEAQDNELSPGRSRSILRELIKKGNTRIIVSGLGASVTEALAEAVGAHNKTAKPDQRILYISLFATASHLAGQSCHRWFFRFAPTARMRMEALLGAGFTRKKTQRWYFVGYDASYERAMVKAGEEYFQQHRPGKRGFTEAFYLARDYLAPELSSIVARMKDRGETVIITSLLHRDLVQLASLARKRNRKTTLYALYGLMDPFAAPYDAGWARQLLSVHLGPVNPPAEPYLTLVRAYQGKPPGIAGSNAVGSNAVGNGAVGNGAVGNGAVGNGAVGSNAVGNGAKRGVANPGVMHIEILDAVTALAEAINLAKSINVDALAGTLSGMKFTSVSGENVEIRSQDNQAIYTLHVSDVREKARVALRGTGSGVTSVWSKRIPDQAGARLCHMNEAVRYEP